MIAERGAEFLSGPARRIATVLGLAAALAEGTVVLDAGRDPAQLRAELVALPGIGPWTAGYLAMRARRPGRAAPQRPRGPARRGRPRSAFRPRRSGGVR